MASNDCPATLTATRTIDDRWVLAGSEAEAFGLANEYLGYLADRAYSPRTVRAYAFDLLHFCRWLGVDRTALDAVTTDTLVRFLAACREAVLPGQHGGNVVDLRSGRSAGYAPATVNRRMAAVSGLFNFRAHAGSDAAESGAPRRGGPADDQGRAIRDARPPCPAPRSVWAAGPRAAPAAERARPQGGPGAAGELPERSRSGDRRADVVLGTAQRRGARPLGHRCRYRPGLGPGDRQGRQGAPGAGRPRRRRAGAGLPARRAARDHRAQTVRGGQGSPPRTAPHLRRAPARLSLPPGEGRRPRRPPPLRCATASAPPWPKPASTSRSCRR